MIHLELDSISVYMEFKVCCIVVKTPKTLEIGMGIAKKYIAIQNHQIAICIMIRIMKILIA